MLDGKPMVCDPLGSGMDVTYYDLPLVTTWDNALIDLGGDLWEPNPEYVEPPTGETIDMDELLNVTKCCEETVGGQCRPQNMVDVLKDKAATLQTRLTDVNLAIQALEKNPELSSTLDLIRRVGRY